MDRSRYNSVSKTARKWGSSWRTIKKWCAAGRIPGVVLQSGHYLIPVDARPSDVLPLTPEVIAEHKRRRMAGRQVAARSGYRGVIYRKGRWAAVISMGGRAVHIGTYDTREEAARAFDKRARELRGKDAMVNFPYDD